jgi:hypothetical protein
MAENDSTDTLDLIETEDQVILSKLRAAAALEATWEIEQLCVALRKVVEDGAEEAYAVRGISKRIQDMACVVMSAMNDTAETTDHLLRRVRLTEGGAE